MIKKIVAIFLWVLIAVLQVDAQSNKELKAGAYQLFNNFYGHYNCKGGNARGQNISADVSFSPALEGNAMVYEHIDHPPLKAHSKAIWSYDAVSKKLVSLSVSSIKDTTLTFSTLLVSDSWSPDSLLFNADTLVAPPFRPNRFIYEKTGKNSLRMTWQVRKEGHWVMGDYLRCEEVHQ